MFEPLLEGSPVGEWREVLSSPRLKYRFLLHPGEVFGLVAGLSLLGILLFSAGYLVGLQWQFSGAQPVGADRRFEGVAAISVVPEQRPVRSAAAPAPTDRELAVDFDAPLPVPGIPPRAPLMTRGDAPALPQVVPPRPSGGERATPMRLASDGEPAVCFDDSQPIPQTPYGELIYRMARRHAINPLLVAAVVRVESGFDPDAVSVKGARGLMQVMPETARRFGIDAAELFNPERNLAAGVHYLSWLSDRYGAEPLRVLAAYNAGEAMVDRYGGVPPFPETSGFIARVYAALGREVP